MFYIIEKKEQLNALELGDVCFLEVIGNNNNYHPNFQSISVIYIYSLEGDKSYMLCVDHNETLSLIISDVLEKLLSIKHIYVLDKKRHLYFLGKSFNLLDINFHTHVNVESLPIEDQYNRKHGENEYINLITPISKLHEKWDNVYNKHLRDILPFKTDDIFLFNNKTSEIFFEIENKGIKLDKKHFIKNFGEKIQHPSFNISNGEIYTHYNLYNTTSRPSNNFNHINFLAINKKDDSRLSFIPKNDYLVDIDFNAYHPRIIADLTGYKFDRGNVYEQIKAYLPADFDGDPKEYTFKQMYGNISDECKDHPFFKSIEKFKNEHIKNHKYYISKNRKLYIEDMHPSKAFNYIIQNQETIYNITFLREILDLLEGLKSNITLYTYDSFMFDMVESELDVIDKIKTIVKFPVSVKIGTNYKDLKIYE